MKAKRIAIIGLSALVIGCGGPKASKKKFTAIPPPVFTYQLQNQPGTTVVRPYKPPPGRFQTLPPEEAPDEPKMAPLEAPPEAPHSSAPVEE